MTQIKSAFRNATFGELMIIAAIVGTALSAATVGWLPFTQG